MNKWCGKIGFFVTEEKMVDGIGTGVWEEKIVEKTYMGDISRDYRKTANSDSVNKNIDISNTISILSNQFINKNLMNIRYVTFKGYKFEVSSIDNTNAPRITMTLGGLYNEK